MKKQYEYFNIDILKVKVVCNNLNKTHTARLATRISFHTLSDTSSCHRLLGLGTNRESRNRQSHNTLQNYQHFHSICHYMVELGTHQFWGKWSRWYFLKACLFALLLMKKPPKPICLEQKSRYLRLKKGRLPGA